MSENTTGVSTVKDNSVKALMARPDVIKKFQEILGKKAQTFATSVIQIVNSNELLKNAEPMSILNCAMVAATLDLPLNNQLGFAWIVPYKENKKDKESGQWTTRVVAQFQIGYKGFNQLAQRTGSYQKINAVPVYENQFKSWNVLTEELEGDFTIEGEGKIRGYCAYFRLLNGFDKVVYWPTEKVKKHGQTYSKSYKTGKWSDGKEGDDFDSMALKTVLKNTLSKWGPLSVEMQKAITVDQGLINDEDGTDVTYIDNQPVDLNKEIEGAEQLIEDCKTWEDLQLLVDSFDSDIIPALEEKINTKRSILQPE